MELGLSAGSGPLPESIWNGKEPRPFDIVEDWEAVDMPRSFLFGGAGRGEPEPDLLLAAVGLGAPVLNACCASGDRGGVRMGLSDIGDGGTKGNPSNIESARVEAALTTEDRSTIRELSSSSIAYRC